MIYTTLDSFYLSKEELEDSPSRREGVTPENEETLRIYGCELIQEAGILLRLPQAVMATGQVLLHRFYCKRSMVTYRVKRVAAAATFLAAKLEEMPKRLRDVLTVFHRLKARHEGGSLEPLDLNATFYEKMRADAIRIERYMLRSFGFIMHVEHPHKFVLNYLQLMDKSDLMQEAWNLANDSLRTTLCVRHKSEVVACGLIYMAARRKKVALPENPPWWDLYGVKKGDMLEVCREVSALYRRPKAQYIKLLPEPATAVPAATPPLQASPASATTAAASAPSLGHPNGEAAQQQQTSAAPRAVSPSRQPEVVADTAAMETAEAIAPNGVVGNKVDPPDRSHSRDRQGTAPAPQREVRPHSRERSQERSRHRDRPSSHRQSGHHRVSGTRSHRPRDQRDADRTRPSDQASTERERRDRRDASRGRGDAEHPHDRWRADEPPRRGPP